ncbi:hypothetical protein LCGC14_2707810 [marine sediment metagenome]|uniref:Uncharacterized protein n=1 Tax=marine sediment metagenome TaxID=412755 RepID=A0A0F9A1K4_9ZZZZ
METIYHLIGSFFILVIWHLFSIGTNAEGIIVIVLINIYWVLESTQSKSKENHNE